MTTVPSLALFKKHVGFSLIELAIVLIIVSLLSGGLMMTLLAQRENAAIAETQLRLSDARDALLGFAAANGRLPCPAAPSTTGVESPPGGGACSNNWDGFLPAITLGIAPTNENGYAIDGWGNPIRYAITNFSHSTLCPNQCFTTTNGIKAIWNGGITPAPDLRICNTAAGMTGSGASADCASGSGQSNNAVAVIFSSGKNGNSTPTSTDEIANNGADRLFVSRTQSMGANEFDDLLVWLSPNILYNRLITAGRLP